MNRRTFLRAMAGLGGLALTSPLLEACSQAPPPIPDPTVTPPATATSRATATGAPTRHPTPTTTATQPIAKESPMSRIAFVKTRDRAAGVNKALDLLDVNSIKGKDLFLKPNF